ncbi:hypothetical protein Tco_0348728 [Tanacetum coccineum]
MAEHSHKWHNKEGDRRISNNGSNSLSTITDKLKNQNRDMNDLRENIHKIHSKLNDEFCHEEVKSIRTGKTKQNNQGFTLKNKPPSNLKETFERYLKESCKRQNILDEWMQQFIKNTNKNLKRHDSAIKNLDKKVVRLAYALAVQKVKQDTPVESSIPNPDSSNLVRQECARKLEPPRETPIHKLCYKTSFHLKKKTQEALSYHASLAIPWNPKPVNMVIEMADGSMQSLKGIVENVLDPFGEFRDSDSNMGIGIDDFIKGMDDLWDDLDPGALTKEIVNPPLKPKFFRNNIVKIAKNLHVFIGCHTFLIDFNILENVNEFVEKGLTEVLFGKPFKEDIGLEEDVNKGVLWFKIGDDKTIFNMPRVERKLNMLTTEQHNMMSPNFKVSDEDKAKGVFTLFRK